MEFLHSSMDHPVSQQCRIYQLEEIRIKAGETPDELVERIRGLADRCNFPTDAEKERHIQFQMVCALSDTDLIRKLLAMKIKATTAEMLAVCCMHIAIADNMSSMSLSTKAVSAVQKMMKTSSHGNPCGNCTKVTLQGESTAQQRTLLAGLESGVALLNNTTAGHCVRNVHSSNVIEIGPILSGEMCLSVH